MAEMVQVRSWKHFWNDYIVEGLKNGAKPADIRRNVVDAFRREIFGQMMFRMNVDDLKKAEETPYNVRIVEKISINEKKKWDALVRHCKKYPETANLLQEGDLTLDDIPANQESA